MDKANEIIDQMLPIINLYGLKILGAVLALIIGLWIIKLVLKTIGKGFEKRNVDASLRPFLLSLISFGLKVMLFIAILSTIGIEMTSFVALLGAAGLAFGMALSGALQNFAGGVVILIFKPFKVGDYVDAVGYAGIVKEIQIFNTILLTVDNRTVIIPNGKVYAESLINYTKEKTRRIDLTFGIAYDTSVETAREIIMSVIERNEKILKDPACFIGLAELADSSVNLTVRPWVKTEDYWPVYFWVNEEVYKAFNEKGITIPFPQMDIHTDK